MMISFHSATLFLMEMALIQPMQTAHGTVRSRKILVVKFESDVGPVWAEAGVLTDPTYHYETVDTVRESLIQWMFPLILGKQFDHPTSILNALNHHIKGHNASKAVIEMAAWAAFATAHGQSLATAIGGSFDRAKIGIVIGDAPESAVKDDIRYWMGQGVGRIKLKITPATTAAEVGRFLEYIPNPVQVILDANGSLETVAFDRIFELCQPRISVLEQPFSKDNLVAHQRLQQRLSIPICCDESTQSIHHLETLDALKACRIVSVKPSRLGGIGPSVSLSRRAHELGVGLMVGGMYETGIGRAYTLAVHSVIHDQWIGDLSPSGRYWAHDLIETPDLVLVGGTLAINRTQPGLGIAVAETHILRNCVWKQTIAK